MHAVRGMNLENLNERIQTQKATYYLHPFMWNIRNRQICEERIYIGGYQGLGRGESGEKVFNGHKFYCGIIEIFWNKIELLVAQLCECGKWHWIVHFKMLDFVSYAFYLNENFQIPVMDPIKYKMGHYGACKAQWLFPEALPLASPADQTRVKLWPYKKKVPSWVWDSIISLLLIAVKIWLNLDPVFCN